MRAITASAAVFFLRPIFNLILLSTIVTTIIDAKQIEYFTSIAVLGIFYSFVGFFSSAYFINQHKKSYRGVQTNINLSTFLVVVTGLFFFDKSMIPYIFVALPVVFFRASDDYHKVGVLYDSFIVASLCSIVIAFFVRLALIILQEMNILLACFCLEDVLRTSYIARKDKISISSFRRAVPIVKSIVVFSVTSLLSANFTKALILIFESVFQGASLALIYAVKLIEVSMVGVIAINQIVWSRLHGQTFEDRMATIRVVVHFANLAILALIVLVLLIQSFDLSVFGPALLVELAPVIIVVPVLLRELCRAQILLSDRDHVPLLYLEGAAYFTLTALVAVLYAMPSITPPVAVWCLAILYLINKILLADFFLRDTKYANALAH